MSNRSAPAGAAKNCESDDAETYARKAHADAAPRAPSRDAPRFDLLTDVIEQVHLEGTGSAASNITVPSRCTCSMTSVSRSKRGASATPRAAYVSESSEQLVEVSGPRVERIDINSDSLCLFILPREADSSTNAAIPLQRQTKEPS